MADDLEDDWASLGRPGKVAKTVRKVQESNFVYNFLNFIFGWIGRAWRGFWGVLFDFRLLILLTFVAGLTVAGYAIFQAFKADGRIDYCTIKKNADDYQLEGHRPWRQDVMLMQKDSREPLLKAAQEQNCPLH